MELLFPDLEALRRVLAGGLLTTHVTNAPLTADRDDFGRVRLRPQHPLPREATAIIGRYGVVVQGANSGPTATAYHCWAQLLPLRPRPTAVESTPLLFRVPQDELHELLRVFARFRTAILGIALPDDDDPTAIAWVRVASAPQLILSRLDESDCSFEAFHEDAAGVWIAFGRSHPLAASIVPPAGTTYLLRPLDEWEPLPTPRFAPLPTNELLPILEPPRGDRPRSVRLNVRLSLRREPPSEPAELWLIETDALRRLGQFVRGHAEWLLDKLEVAFSDAGPNGPALLRRRSLRGDGPVIALDAIAMRPYLKIPNLFLPTNLRLFPSVRRDLLRATIAPDVERCYWLLPIPTEPGLRIGSVPLKAFRSLKELLRYRCEDDRIALAPWQETDPFALLPYEVKRFDNLLDPLTPSTVLRRNPANDLRSVSEVPTSRPSFLARLKAWWRGLFAPAPPPPSLAVAEPPKLSVEEAVRTFLSRPAAIEPVPEPAAPQERREGLETRLLNSFSRLDDSQRASLWPELAAVYERSGNHADAAVCWLNALWEQPNLSDLWAWGWVRSENRPVGWDLRAATIRDWLRAPALPMRVRTIAAYVVWNGLQESPQPELREHLNEVREYLHTHEAMLPVRAVWLAQGALAGLSGGDVLGLARTRDRLLSRLRTHGLSLDLDAPSFLRFAAQGVNDRFQTIRERLIQWRPLMQRWLNRLAGRGGQEAGQASMGFGGRPRHNLQGFGLDMEITCTRAYGDLIFAWGLARLGEISSSAKLLEGATEILRNDDPVHEFLLQAFTYRIEQAQEGKPHRGTLPTSLTSLLDEIPRDPRYCIDKMRQQLEILEPLERIDGYRGAILTHYSGMDELSKSLTALPDQRDPERLAARIRELLEGASTIGPEATLPRIMSAVLDVLPRLGETPARHFLNRLLPALDAAAQIDPPGHLVLQLRLLERGIFIAGHFDQTVLVQLLVQRFLALLDGHKRDLALRDVEGFAASSLRSLRRLGLRTELERLLQSFAEWVLRGEELETVKKMRAAEWPSILRTLLYNAAGWFYMGQERAATTILDEARDLLFAAELAPGERTSLALVYAKTLGQAPTRFGLGRLQEIFERLRGLQTSGTTNTHYTLKPLELIETIVRAVVNEDFTLGPLVRGWLDDDEFLIRRRIQRELTGSLNNASTTPQLDV